MDPDSLGRGCCQDPGVEQTYCFGNQRLVPARQWLLSPYGHGRLTRRKGTTSSRIGRNVFGRRHVQGRQKSAERSRFSRERGRQGSNVALKPRNDAPGPGELGAWNADDHWRGHRQRKSGREDRKPALLVPVKIDRDRASSDPDRQHVAEPPHGVVPPVSHLHRTQAGKVRSLFFEKADYQPPSMSVSETLLPAMATSSHKGIKTAYRRSVIADHSQTAGCAPIACRLHQHPAHGSTRVIGDSACKAIYRDGHRGRSHGADHRDLRSPQAGSDASVAALIGGSASAHPRHTVTRRDNRGLGSRHTGEAQPLPWLAVRVVRQSPGSPPALRLGRPRPVRPWTADSSDSGPVTVPSQRTYSSAAIRACRSSRRQQVSQVCLPEAESSAFAAGVTCNAKLCS